MSESNQRTDTRESMWAIRPRWSPLYFALFTLQVGIGLGVAVHDGLTSKSADGWVETYFDIILRTGQVGIAAAIITFAVIELMGSIMLMSEWIRETLVEPAKEKQRSRIEMRREEGRAQGFEEGLVQGLEKGRGRGRAEGREEARAELIEEIRDWDNRRRDAERRGESFDEPPPYSRNVEKGAGN